MTTLQTAAQQALEALLTPSGAQACSTCQNGPENEYCCRMEMWSAVDALRAALAQQEEPVQEPVAWLQPKTVDGYSRPDLGYETCSKDDYGAFPVHTAPPRCPNCASLEAQNNELDRKLAELERAEPAAVVGTQVDVWRGCDGRWAPPGEPIKTALMLKDMPVGTMLYTAPPQRKPLTEEEIYKIYNELWRSTEAVDFARAIEREHGIGGQP